MARRISIASRRAVARAAAFLLLATALLSVRPTDAAAQRRPGQTVLHGTVVDADTREPLFGAFVAGADDRGGVLTDSLGRFSLPIDRADSYPLRFVQLGYHTLTATMPKEAETRLFTVGLKPDAVEIEGLTVLADKLADRRRGPFGVVRLLDQHELLDTSVGTAAELLRQVMPFAQKCSPDADSLCYANQGHKQPVQVCMDGRSVPSDSPELDALDPRGLYLVEAYSRVGQVRFYSRGYVQRLAQSGQDLPPMNFGCGGAMEGGPGGLGGR